MTLVLPALAPMEPRPAERGRMWHGRSRLSARQSSSRQPLAAVWQSLGAVRWQRIFAFGVFAVRAH